MTSSLATLIGALPLLVAEGGAGSILSNPMIPMLGMFAIIYFMVLRPMSKQEKDRKARVEGLKKGDEVVLQGGILGRISSIDDDIAMVEIADRVKVRVLKKDINDTRDAAKKAAAKDGKAKDGKAKADTAKDDKKDDKDDGKDAKAAS